jgi:hypothetical protein
MKWTGNVARMGEMNVYKILVGKLEENKPVEKHKRRCEKNIKIGLGR